MAEFRGNYISGEFVASGGDLFQSHNPAMEDAVVLSATGSRASVDDAVQAARDALPAWRRLPTADRIEALERVKACLPEHTERIAEAITLEMGKVLSEARVEAKSIAGKIDALLRLLPVELPPRAHPAAPGYQRFHSHGVMAVIGPFNFPIHLVNTHVIPALITGNTVVVKPSEITPLTAQRYAELFDAAGFPPGVFNLVQGGGPVGAALVTHGGVDVVAFTGSYKTGRMILGETIDQPEKKVALEMGGKNVAVVVDDADIDQAVREILLGALLTTGQRCTATSRVVATPGVADQLIERLVAALPRVRPGDPTAPETFMGPLACRRSLSSFEEALLLADQQATVLVKSERVGACFVTPGMHEVTGEEAVVTEELFGPHIAFERAADNADAIRRANGPFGLSASLFTRNEALVERFYDEVRAGVININRSTNGASGLLPFGGVGRSGNFHPTGSASLRLATYPVAFMREPHGSITSHAVLEAALEGPK